MSLGNNIHRLRTKQNMSQGDLAEALGVSRQSISKWETDGAVPELEKLVKLSTIFNVTLDELVHGEPSAPQPEPQSDPVPSQSTVPASPTHRIAALIWLALAFLCLLGFTFLGAPAAGVLFMIPFLACCLVCLICKRHPILYGCWVILILVDLYLRYATGLSWTTTRLTYMWTPHMNYMRLATAWGQLLCMLVMIAATVLTYRKAPLTLTGRSRARYLIGWAALIAVYILMRLSASVLNLNFDPWYFLYSLLDWCRILLFTLQLTSTIRWLHSRKTA